MNLSDLEQRMKEDFDEIDFSPKVHEWERMQEALKPRRASLLLLLPFHKAVAAAALLVCIGTTGLYLFFSRPEKNGIVLSPDHSKHLPAAPRAAQHFPKPDEAEPNHYPTFSGIAKKDMLPAKAQDEPVLPEPGKHNILPVTPEDPVTTIQEQPLATNHDNSRKRSLPRTAEQPGYDHYLAAANSNNALRLGLAANVGKPSLGNVQYNFGVVARKNLSGKLYAEANVSLSSSNISYWEQGPPVVGIPGDGLSNVTEPTNLNFNSNIISIGVAPSLGFKVAPKLSVSAGGDLYRALNRNLKPQFTEAEFNKGVKPKLPGDNALPERNITNWDFGLKAQVEYKLNPNFSLSTQYRQGLTQYILIDGKSLKNSNFTLGLKFYFDKER